MRNRDRDPFTGKNLAWQAGRVDERYLTPDGRFDLAAFNRLNDETCDIADPTSMSALYRRSVTTFTKHILPELDFVQREGPIRLSCISSLAAHAEVRQAMTKERQRKAGREIGVFNLIRRTRDPGS